MFLMGCAAGFKWPLLILLAMFKHCEVAEKDESKLLESNFYITGFVP